MNVESTWLRAYSKLVTFAVLILIFAGALVTSHSAGLAVPDWPTTYGQNMFLFPYSEWRGNIFFEHSHRLIASSVGVLTVILAIWIGRSEPRRWVRVLSYLALVAVIIQGILGGLTVKYLLPAPISIAHGILAQTFLVMVVVIAYSQSRELQIRLSGAAPSGNRALFRQSIFLIVTVYIQLFLGALMRHTESGLAIPDFPRMAGEYLPYFNDRSLTRINDMLFQVGLDPVTIEQVWVHFAHRSFAFVVVAAVIGVGVYCLRRTDIDRRISTLAKVLILLVVIQFILGISTVLSLKAPYLTSLHVLIGALTLITTILLSLRSYPLNQR